MSTLISLTLPATLKLKVACSSAASVPGAVTVWVNWRASDFASLTCLGGKLAVPCAEEATCASLPPHPPNKNRKGRNKITNRSFACVILELYGLMTCLVAGETNYIRSDAFFHSNPDKLIMRILLTPAAENK